MLTYASVCDSPRHEGQKVCYRKEVPAGWWPMGYSALPYPSCQVHNVQANILSLACIFKFEGMLSMSEEVKESLRLGKEALVCPKHSPV